MIGEPELIHFASKRFKDKLFAALGVVKQALDTSRQPYIAFSGGKDSLAVTALVHTIAPDVQTHWSDDELEYPEIPDYMTDIQAIAGSQFSVSLGYAYHNGWFFPWRDRPYWREPLPGTKTINGDVDDWMASNHYDLTFLGLRMNENRKRRDWLIQAGPLYWVKAGTKRRCNPIWDWTEDDVWALIAGWHLPYCKTYDRLEEIGVHRHYQRIGPLPLARRQDLRDGWPGLIERLEARYGQRWER